MYSGDISTIVSQIDRERSSVKVMTKQLEKKQMQLSVERKNRAHFGEGERLASILTNSEKKSQTVHAELLFTLENGLQRFMVDLVSNGLNKLPAGTLPGFIPDLQFLIEQDEINEKIAKQTAAYGD